MIIPPPFRLVPLALCSALALTACDDEPIPENNDGCTDDWFAAHLGALDPASGSLACAAGGASGDAAPAFTCVEERSVPATTVDHQSGDPVPGVDVRLWFTDDHTLGANVDATSDAEAAFTEAMPTCQPFSYRTDRGAGGEARVTLAQHKVLDPAADPFTYEFRSVSDATVNLISSPLFYGVEVEAGKGMVFGKAIGCDGEAISNVQVLVRDASCKVPGGSLVGYTSNEIPNTLLRGTSADGYFFAVNVPAGDWVVEMYGDNGDGTFALLGSAPVSMEPDGVTLVDIKAGRSDGLHLPAACVSCN